MKSNTIWELHRANVADLFGGFLAIPSVLSTSTSTEACLEDHERLQHVTSSASIPSRSLKVEERGRNNLRVPHSEVTTPSNRFFVLTLEPCVDPFS